MRLFRPGFIAGCLYPEALFRIKTTEKLLFLTFDDGPDPGSTPQLLNILHTFNVPALFFCNGSAAGKYPDLISQIRHNGHLTGNHGYSHLDGWKTDAYKYRDDVLMASALTSVKLFRPPFGRLTLKQRNLLDEFQIVFWDIMAYDFDLSFGAEKTLKVLKRKIRPGSIIVLHDTPASCANRILGEFIEFAVKEGYRFVTLDWSPARQG